MPLSKLPIRNGASKMTRLHNRLIERYNACVQVLNGQDTPDNIVIDLLNDLVRKSNEKRWQKHYHDQRFYKLVKHLERSRIDDETPTK